MLNSSTGIADNQSFIDSSISTVNSIVGSFSLIFKTMLQIIDFINGQK